MESRRGRRNLAGAIFCLNLACGAYAVEPLQYEGFLDLSGKRAGTTALSFLKLPIGARALAMGGRSLTTEREASLVQSAPASLPLNQGHYYSFSHGELLGEFRHEYFALAMPAGELGHFGLSADALIASEFLDSRDIDENPVSFSAEDLALGLGFGRFIWQDRLSIGGRLDLIRSAITEVEAYGYSLSAGALFFLVGDFRLALAAQNLSHGIRYRKKGPLEPLPAFLVLETGKPLGEDDWAFSAGLSHGNEGLALYHGGVERRLGRYLMVRTGYDGSVSDRQLGPSAGISFGLGLEYLQFSLDYGVRLLGPLGTHHAFTLNYSRQTERHPEDERLVEKAQRCFRQGRYAKALRLARKALQINPSNWKAHALAKQARDELARLDHRTISVFITGNTSGQVLPVPAGGRFLGGLPRRASKLKELMRFYPNALALDAGNLTGTGLSARFAEYIYKAYALLPYAAVNVGAGEWRRENDLLRRADLPWLSAQFPAQEQSWRPRESVILSPGRRLRLRIIGGIDPSGAASPSGAVRLAGDLVSVLEALLKQKDDPEERMPTVLLLHGGVDLARRLAASYAELDAIVLSGPDMPDQAVRAGGTLIIPSGPTHIGHLSFKFTREGKLISSDFRSIALGEDVSPDPEMTAFLQKASLRLEDWQVPPDPNPYTSPFFVYAASSPGKNSRLFLFDLMRHQAKALPTSGISVSRPAWNPGELRMAFGGEDGSGARELYALGWEDSLPRALTREGGMMVQAAWKGKALYCLYELEGRADLHLWSDLEGEAANLTQGRFGQITGFALDPGGAQLALAGTREGRPTLWVGDARAQSMLPLAEMAAVAGAPQWDPRGETVAILARPRGDTGSHFEIHLLNLASGGLTPITEKSRVRGLSWGRTGDRLYYWAGVNLTDIRVFERESGIHRKVTEPRRLEWRSESQARPKMRWSRHGLLMVVRDGASERIQWLDPQNGEEIPLVEGESDYVLE